MLIFILILIVIFIILQINHILKQIIKIIMENILIIVIHKHQIMFKELVVRKFYGNLEFSTKLILFSLILSIDYFTLILMIDINISFLIFLRN